MFPVDLQYNASAIVIWLPEGDTPTEGDFDLNSVMPPPAPNPCAKWFLHEALADVILNTKPPEGKAPWIKYGNKILDKEAIMNSFKKWCEAQNASNP